MAAGNTPPRLAAMLLTLRLSGTEVGRTILGDFAEEFAERASHDPAAARRWYRREAWGVVLRKSAVARRSFVRQLQPPGDSVMTRLLVDIRLAFRTLFAAPRFTVIAALTLAIGVGASSAIFAVVNGILLQPLPYANANRIVNVWSHAPSIGYDQFPLSPDLYFLYERDNDVFDDMALFQRRRGNFTLDGGTPDVVDTIVATHTYFSTLGISPTFGRAFTADEDRPGEGGVVVISHRAWRDRFGSDPAILERRVRLDGADLQVIGVTPTQIDGTGTPDFFLPALHDRENPIQGNFGWNAVARLREGVTPEMASTHLVPLVQRMADTATSPTYRAFLVGNDYAPRVRLMKEDVIGSVEQPLWILLGTVGILLLIACANVANLFLVRAEGRQLEIAIRVAMGAARATMVRAMLVEAIVLASIGAGVGLAAVAVGLPALLRLAPPTIPRLHLVHIDWTVAAFVVAITFVSAMLFGLIPALRYTRPRSLGVLRHGTRGSDEPARQRARHGLVIVQTALAVILLVGSGLLARSFSRLLSTDPGFKPDSVMTFRLSLPPTQYRDDASMQSFADRMVAGLRALPGVTAVAAVNTLPIANAAPGTAHVFEHRQGEPGVLPPIVHYKVVVGDYFDTMGIPLLAGRMFHSGDRADDAQTAIVNQALVDEFFPNMDPIGKRVRQGGEPAPGTPPAPWITIVGVVGTERQDGLRRPARPLIYYAQSALSPASLRTLDYAVRGAGITTRGEELRRAVWAIDSGLPVAALRPMQEILDTSVVDFTFTMVTLGIAALLALVLGAVGLYGVLSYAVTLRTKEIGVRMALGAQPSVVLRSVVARGFVLAAIGLGIGLAAAAGLTQLMDGLLFETAPLDPLTFVSMSAALLLVAGLASYLPARRAAHVSPLESMKQ
jgi:predicted permease